LKANNKVCLINEFKLTIAKNVNYDIYQDVVGLDVGMNYVALPK